MTTASESRESEPRAPKIKGKRKNKDKEAMKIFTTKEIREIDRYTIENEGVDGLELMDRAATGVVLEVMSRFRPNQR